MANGHGGARRNSGRPTSAPRVVARRLTDAAVAYCQGIAGGDLRDPDAVWERYLSQVRAAGREARARDRPAAVATSFAMLDRAASIRVAEDVGDGLSGLMRALEHGASVPDWADPDQEGDRPPVLEHDAGHGAPEPCSGAPGSQAQLPLFASGAGEAIRAPSGRPQGAAPLPPLPSPPHNYVPDPQNLDFVAETRPLHPGSAADPVAEVPGEHKPGRGTVG